MAEIIGINNIDCEELAVYSQLSEAQLRHIYEPAQGLFIAESPKVIERAMSAGYEPVSMLAQEGCLTGETAQIIAKAGNISVYIAPESVLTGITGFRLTRGLLCAMRRRELPSAQALCRDMKRIAVLDSVVNPTNVGAIFRSAAALGMEAVLLTPPCSDPLYRRAARVSMGTVFQIAWTYLPKGNLPEQLRKMGFASAAMALSDDSVSVDDSRLAAEKRLAIIMGTEGDGLSAETVAGCDYTVKIPMAQGVDSLNVAAASAVAFWALGGFRGDSK